MTVIHIIRREFYSKVFKKLSFSSIFPRLSGHHFSVAFRNTDPVYVQFSRPIQNFFTDLVFLPDTRVIELFKTQILDNFASEQERNRLEHLPLCATQDPKIPLDVPLSHGSK